MEDIYIISPQSSLPDFKNHMGRGYIIQLN